ncbi:polyamine aminopropyltransferase 1 [Dulcicalothrix desertica PCC 7102]|uniref:Polyamine aminopropyltransferase n=1 Tax=Dulcicalothrix desertica PCC 7102 TaxID=232991 RepID=A0A3S1AMB3_9CYAN|nr:polyamine aminopropyltransferase [Dulcicalothrix desertica]RUT04572.1 polyamine aminopropyltransferase 1 [Dulcicalothrix desertica PCC 7102]TWH42583.1 spermidine synthase [Dulcicalothrix desertica PCC 7102]
MGAETEESIFINKVQRRTLLLAAAVSSGTGLAVELLLGNLASYLMGNQALAYGIAIGGFLAAMGIGSYLSRFIAPKEQGRALQREMLTAFIKIELLIAPLTALLPMALFALFVADSAVIWQALFVVTILLGILAGLEVPILARLLEIVDGVRDAISGVLALDYLGGLLGSLAFPLLLLPFLSMFPTAFVLGAFPALMVFAIGQCFPSMRRWGYAGLILGIVLLISAPASIPLGNKLENNLYNAPIIKRVQSTYQRIVLTRQGKDLRLFLDGDLQFSTVDEYRYHEALVHPAMSAVPKRKKVLVLGAGDGMAVREVLKWQGVERVVLIELDPTIVKLATRYPQLAKVNANSLKDPRVQVINADAFVQAPKLPDIFDVIIADFPDPDHDSLAKLYSDGFYRRLMGRLAENGVLVTQASSSFFTPKVISCITATIAHTGLMVHPYVADVPSFGPWGFVLASRNNIDTTKLKLEIPTRYLTTPLLQHIFELPKDIEFGNTEINRLTHPVIVRYQSQESRIRNIP